MKKICGSPELEGKHCCWKYPGHQCFYNQYCEHQEDLTLEHLYEKLVELESLIVDTKR